MKQSWHNKNGTIERDDKRNCITLRRHHMINQSFINLDTVDTYLSETLGDSITNTVIKPDIIAIASKFGFKVVIADMDDGDGFILVNDEELIEEYDCHRVIGVNSKKSLKSKRYIIAKELGYYIVQRQLKDPDAKLKIARIDQFDDEHADEQDTQEVIDWITGSLLMPRNSVLELKTQLSKNKITDTNAIAIEMSNKYDVSVTNAIRRIELLDKQRNSYEFDKK
jgi:hypothetical protein